MLALTFRLVVCIHLLVLGASLGIAQQTVEGRTTGNITGQIRYSPGSQPAFNVLVSCDSFAGGLIGQHNTDRNGRFEFRNLPLGQYVITVRVTGYIEERRDVELQKTPDQYLQILLRPDLSQTSTSKPSVVNSNIPQEAQIEYDKAQQALASNRKDRFETAISHLEKAVSLYPNFAEASLSLGTAYMDIQRWDKAEQTLLKIVEMDPKTVNALFALGEIYLYQKKDEAAEKVLLQGLAMESRSPRGHLELARVYWNMGNKFTEETQSRPLLEKAYTEVNEALKLNAGFADAHLLRGNLYLKARRPKDALNDFEEYLRLDPKGKFAEQTRASTDKIKNALEKKN